MRKWCLSDILLIILLPYLILSVKKMEDGMRAPLSYMAAEPHDAIALHMLWSLKKGLVQLCLVCASRQIYSQVTRLQGHSILDFPLASLGL